MSVPRGEAYRVLVVDKTDDIDRRILTENGLEVVKKPKITTPELIKEIKDYDALIVRSRKIKDPEIFENAHRLKVICRAGTGYDNIDRDLASKNGIVVMTTPEGNVASTAELTIGHMLALARNIPESNKKMHRGEYDKAMGGFVLRGKTLGIIGFGRIGSTVGTIARAMGMNVITYDPLTEYVPRMRDEKIKQMEMLGVKRVSLDDIFKRSNIITLHPDLNENTREMVNLDRLDLCENPIHLINCSRGGVINENAVRAHLEAGTIIRMGVDVLKVEPSNDDQHSWKDSPLVGHKRVHLTPHQGGTTEESLHATSQQAAEQICGYLYNGMIRNAVNQPFKGWEDEAKELGCECYKKDPIHPSERKVAAAQTGKVIHIPGGVFVPVLVPGSAGA